MTDVDIALDVERDGTIIAKLSAPAWEVNIRGTRAEFAELSGIADADWASRGSIRAGMVAGAPAFWSASDDQASLLIGADDEVWDIALTMHIDVVENLSRQARELSD